MKKHILAALAVCTAAPALAGGLDRSGQSVTPLFADGNVVTFSLGYVAPSITGTDAAATATGDVGNDFPAFGVSYKRDLNPTWSMAVMFDEPYGGDVTYGASSPVYGGTSADVSSSSFTALGQYNMQNGFSLHGGLRTLKVDADVTLSGAAYGGLSGYNFTGEGETAFGYVVGAAYERPDIALRVSLTYTSEIDFDMSTVESISGASDITVTAPQSVNLEFQTGIMADTLLFGSVRWVNWDGFNVTPTTLATPLVEYTDDVITYSAGIGRRFNDNWSGALTVGYEETKGGTVSALGPTDGFLSVGAGATYTMDNGNKVTGGVQYIMPGDADVASGGSTATMTDNSIIAAGLKFEMKL